MADDPDVTRPKLHLEVPDLEERRTEYRRQQERRHDYSASGQRKVVALPMMWLVTTLGTAIAMVFWIGFNWASTLREIQDMRGEVRELREVVRNDTARFADFDKSVAILQKQLEFDSVQRREDARRGGK